jgi:hypothetical protein
LGDRVEGETDEKWEEISRRWEKSWIDAETNDERGETGSCVCWGTTEAKTTRAAHVMVDLLN